MEAFWKASKKFSRASSKIKPDSHDSGVLYEGENSVEAMVEPLVDEIINSPGFCSFFGDHMSQSGPEEAGKAEVSSKFTTTKALRAKPFVISPTLEAATPAGHLSLRTFTYPD